jgi:protein TonB
MRYSVSGDNNIALKVSTQVNEAVAGARGRGGSTIQTPFGPVTPPAATPFGTLQPAAGEAGPRRVRVGASVMAANLIQQVQPEYPPLARQAQISGVVVLEAVVGVEGTVSSLQVMTGHPLLVQPAIDAVSRWVYRPTLLNGEPVETITTVSVNFVYQPQ